MNNQVGNYVHARYNFYLKYSITEDKEQSPPSVNSICENQKNHLFDECKRSTFLKNIGYMRAELERHANFFFNAKNNTAIKTELDSDQVNAIESAIMQFCREKYDGEVAINFETGKVDSINSLYFDVTKADTDLINAINKTKKLKDGKNRSFKALQERYELLIKLRDELGRIGVKGFPKGRDLMRQLSNLSQVWTDFLQKANTYMKKRGRTDQLPIGKAYAVIPYVSKYGSISATPRKGYERLDHYLDNLISSLLISNASAATGDVGEMIIRAGDYVAKSNVLVGTQEILSYLKRTLPSTSRKGVLQNNISWYGSIHFDKDFDPISNDKTKAKYINEDDFHIQVTQDKVDYTANINGWEVNQSIKNYNLASKGRLIHLEGGSDLLRYAQDYPVFTNHFLNIVGDRSKNEYKNYTDNEPSEKDIQIMHDTMKLTAFLKAIAGGVITDRGRNAIADTFIINDNSKPGNYKVYFISEILDIVSKNIDLINFSAYDSAIWPNIWFGEPDINQKYKAMLRISYLMSTMRQMKINIYLNNKALTLLP